MSFQWVFDNAESIGVNTRKIVGQTITRNQTVRAVNRGNSVVRFTVKLPDGMPWDQVATYISALETADRFTKQNVRINNADYTSWINNGPLSNPNKVWSLICTQFPDYTIFARNQVSWNGSFVFYEALV